MRTSLAVNDGQWHHVAVTRNAFDGEMAIYLDGVLNTNTFGPTGPRTSPPVLRLGSLQSGVAGKFYQGAMDDVRLYNGLLSADSIAALATAPQPNAPPVMAPIADQTLIAGQVLNLTNNASDPDVPPQTLTWSLRSPPPGATINTNTGLIQWRPTIARSPGTNPMQVVVTDNGVPSLSDTQQFTVTVLKPVEPRMDSPQVAGGAFTTSVSGDAGPDYTVLGSTNLTTWSAILTTNPVTLPVVLQIPVSNAVPQQFYRIQLGP
jgi:hypothetical protein